MNSGTGYTKYHPKWHRVRKPIFWWIHKWEHIRFITRELTSVFVATYALVLTFEVRALLQGPEAFVKFLDRLQTPVSVFLHTVGLLFVLFHTFTWFNLAPKALSLTLGKKRVPAFGIAALHYVAWAVVSMVIVWILVRML